MRAIIATLCDGLDVRPDGSIDLRGGYPEVVALPRLPWSGTVKVGLLLQFEAVDDPNDLRLKLEIVRARDLCVLGQAAASSIERRRRAVEDGAPVYLPLEVEVPVSFDDAGQHAVVLHGPGGARLAFTVFVVGLEASHR